MEIIGNLIVPAVGVITLAAVVVGYRMGIGAAKIISIPKRKSKVSEENRKADVIAKNIEAYDGTPESQQEVK